MRKKLIWNAVLFAVLWHFTTMATTLWIFVGIYGAHTLWLLLRLYRLKNAETTLMPVDPYGRGTIDDFRIVDVPIIGKCINCGAEWSQVGYFEGEGPMPPEFPTCTNCEQNKK